MRTVLLNLPWSQDGRLGVRAGSRWPFTSLAEKDGYINYIPFPFFLAYAASLLKRHGKSVTLMDAIAEKLKEEEVLSRTKSYNPDLIVIETSTPSFKNDLKIINNIHDGLADCKIALCGPHASVFPEEILREHSLIDYLLIGEYEFILLELVNALENNLGLQSILGLAYWEDGKIRINNLRSTIDNLDNLPWPERETLPIYKYNDGFAGLPTPNVQMWSCYDQKTEILTKNGWKKFVELSYSDKIATFNLKTSELEYQNPKRIFVYNYQGKLFRIESTQIDLLITPNHKVLVDKNRREKFELVDIEQLITKKHFEFKKDAIWKGEEQRYFFLPPVKFRKNRRWGTLKIIQQRKIPMDDWLEFFGYYISEGDFSKKSNNRYIIKISQNKESKAWSNIKKIIERIGFSYYIVKRNGKKVGFEISNKQLLCYLKQFGKAHNKFIPKEIKQLSKRQLLILFNALMLGDGSFEQGGRVWSYTSSSKRLIDDVQEILLKVGFSGNIKNRGTKDYPAFRIRINKHQNSPRLNYSMTSQHIKLENYKGNVFCCKVPNQIIYVRRNGKACWSGNSRGCPFRCIFCLWPQTIYREHRYRKRNPIDVVNEMEYLIKEFNFSAVYFDDDVFNIDRTHVLDICNEIRNRKIKILWAAMCRADLMDDELLKIMASSGMYAVKYGVESANQDILDFCKKNMDLKKAYQMIKLTMRLGIKVHLTFCLGLPRETKQTVKETFDFIQSLRPHSLQFSFATPFPGTEYFRYMEDNGLIISRSWHEYDGNARCVIRTEGLSSNDLERIRVDFCNNFDL